MRRLPVLALVAGIVAVGPVAISPAQAAHPSVLRVGTWHGVKGTYSSVQAAVRAAHRGDWILVGPGDYKEHGYRGAPEPAGVLITTPGLHLRGMDRNRVVIDGTKRGSPRCSARKSDQVFTKDGRDGVMALKVNGVYFENLTVCNYLTGTNGGEGNEIWWNGGDGSGKIGMGTWWGNYLTATSTYSNGVDHPRGEYGIFVSNARGPGSVDHSYASNMGDAAYYIGACPDCHALVTHAHGQYSALAYSGTNSGGHLIIENSEWDHNKSGPTSNSQNNDDAPSPESGRCSGGEKGPLGLGICTIWRNNYVHDNNNPNVPGAGAGSLAGSGPVGAGFVLAGTRGIALYHNRIERNGSWGVLVTDLPDQENPPTEIGQNCQGGQSVIPPGTPGQDALCYYPAVGNAVLDNTFKDNGGFGNPSNGDIGIITAVTTAAPGAPASPGNCVQGNRDPAGVTSDPPGANGNPAFACADPNPPNTGDPGLQTVEALCATELLFPCPADPGARIVNYPRATRVVLHMPPRQPTMPHPCAGVPANPWCPAAASSRHTTHHRPGSTSTRSASLARTGSSPWLIITASVLCLLAGSGLWLRRRRL